MRMISFQQLHKRGRRTGGCLARWRRFRFRSCNVFLRGRRFRLLISGIHRSRQVIPLQLRVDLVWPFLRFLHHVVPDKVSQPEPPVAEILLCLPQVLLQEVQRDHPPRVALAKAVRTVVPPQHQRLSIPLLDAAANLDLLLLPGFLLHVLAQQLLKLLLYRLCDHRVLSDLLVPELQRHGDVARVGGNLELYVQVHRFPVGVRPVVLDHALDVLNQLGLDGLQSLPHAFSLCSEAAADVLARSLLIEFHERVGSIRHLFRCNRRRTSLISFSARTVRRLRHCSLAVAVFASGVVPRRVLLRAARFSAGVIAFSSTCFIQNPRRCRKNIFPAVGLVRFYLGLLVPRLSAEPEL
mmetsp:Transcript_14164/g.35149  ORF Transcript_14164/g.35149 Transcript_14164/m.35149 type:complete len:352 (-) Transcript_14164:816-1871(-)